MSSFTQAQIMLSLSLLSYRGFWNPSTDKQQAMVATLEEGLQAMEPLRGNWRLVWGPGSYRHLGSAFDSSMMYVVQHTTHESRYAIVIRGTNPVDLFDWLLGDLLAHRQVPWRRRDVDVDVAPGAMISLSTALGLKVLLNMRADTEPGEAPEPGKFNFLFDLGARMASYAKGSELASKLTSELASELLDYQKILGLVEQVSSGLASRLHSLLQGYELLRLLSVRRRVIGLMDQSWDSLTDAPLAILMPEPEELRAADLPGVSLLEFLGSLSQLHGDTLELFVTGHSKGGALAPALALFLCDTQNNDELAIDPHYQWNPDSRAKIHCYAFAGPTPGNRAFAQYFNRRMGRHFFRYANQLDIVTHAWEGDRLRRVGEIYGDSVSSPPGLEVMFKEMAEEVDGLDYCHPG